MTVTELSNILKVLLRRYERVEIPSVGTLHMEHMPSQIINEGTAITPPSSRIYFDSSVVEMDFSDSEVVKEYAASKGIAQKKAEEEVRSLVKSLKGELLEHSQLSLPEFGKLLFSDNSTFIFEPHPSFDPQAGSFGLESLPLRAMPESVPEPESVPDPQQEHLQEVADNEPQVEQEAEQGAEADPKKANKRKLPLYLIIVLSIIGLIVLLVLVVIVFKEELTPLLERILYSKEELQFLRENGL